MVTLDTNMTTLKKYIGKPLDRAELEEILFRMGFEIEEVEGDEVKIDITPDRMDMVSPQGCARAVAGYINAETGLKEYKTKKSGWKVKVHKNTQDKWPYVAAAIVKNLKFDDETIKEIIWVQEKLGATYARNRKKAGFGIYPLKGIEAPIDYIATDWNTTKFVPLEFNKEMTGKEILKKHPTGEKYAHLIEKWDKPIYFIDKKKQVLSMPPIINSQTFGHVDENTGDVFVEATGSDMQTVHKIMNMMITMLADAGGEVYTLDIEYPNGKIIATPDLKTHKRKISVEYVNKWLGLEIKAAEMKDLLERMRYGVGKVTAKDIEVIIPAYRTDVWHDVDIVDDIARAYGFDNLIPEMPEVPTTGGMKDESYIFGDIRTTLQGLGFQGAFTLALTNKEVQFKMMQLPEISHIKLGHTEEASINMVRVSLIPEIMRCYNENRHNPYPQRIFEVSDVIIPDDSVDVKARNVTRVVCASSHPTANYTEMLSVLEALCNTMEWTLEVKKADYPLFLPGRSASITVNGKKGIIGEIHPQVLVNFGLENPIATFEFEV